jgi:ribosomal protein L19E
MIKLGNFRSKAEDIRHMHNLKRIEFDVLLWGAEREWFSAAETETAMRISLQSTRDALTVLVEKGYVRITRNHQPGGIPRRYSITGKARSIVIMFNTIMKNV